MPLNKITKEKTEEVFLINGSWWVEVLFQLAAFNVFSSTSMKHSKCCTQKLPKAAGAEKDTPNYPSGTY